MSITHQSFCQTHDWKLHQVFSRWWCPSHVCGGSLDVTSVGALGIGPGLIFTHNHCNNRKNEAEVRALEEMATDTVPLVRRNIKY